LQDSSTAEIPSPYTVLLVNSVLTNNNFPCLWITEWYNVTAAGRTLLQIQLVGRKSGLDKNLGPR